MSFSILILTFNEDANLPKCLASISWAQDIVVLDSFSSDRTVEIAKASNARVFQRRFDNFANQRNYALEHIKFENSWLFQLDADEHFTEALRVECEEAASADMYSGYLVPSKTILHGRWLRYSGMYPSYQMRFLKIGEICFEQKGHGQRESTGKRSIGYLREPYLHFSFSKGFDEWYEKHKRYAEQEALETIKELSEGKLDWKGFFSFGDPVRRRRATKQLAMRLPCRSALRFIYMYFFRFGLLDGTGGLKYCKMLAWYEGQIAQSVKKLKKNRNSSF